jgi:hypothetical protein
MGRHHCTRAVGGLFRVNNQGVKGTRAKEQAQRAKGKGEDMAIGS